MNGKVTLRQVRESDHDQIIAILNYYAANGYAAYPERPVPERFFPSLREGTFSFYVLDSPEGILSFGLTKPFFPFPTFSRSGLLTYFIRPECLNRGLGTKLLDRLGRDARKMGLFRMVANMASRNDASVRFHKKHGFEEAGRLRNVGVKFGEPFHLDAEDLMSGSGSCRKTDPLSFPGEDLKIFVRGTLFFTKKGCPLAPSRPGGGRRRSHRTSLKKSGKFLLRGSAALLRTLTRSCLAYGSRR